jgi:hypothetical protein
LRICPTRALTLPMLPHVKVRHYENSKVQRISEKSNAPAAMKQWPLRAEN